MSPLRQRKSPRLPGYDYAQDGTYFVTICTHNRVNLFGAVVDNDMRLNPLGCIAQTCWEEIPRHFPYLEPDVFVVMPNHVHGLVVINRACRDTNGRDTIYRVPTKETFSHPVTGSLAAVIRTYKAAVTRQINRVLGMDDFCVWQGRYHDHIVRNEETLNQIRQYVLTNPARWLEDIFYSAVENGITGF